MVYDNCKIYGPYKRKDGRQHIIAIFGDGTRRTVSYPKYLVECSLNRYLDADETVDHIDCNIDNNSIENLRVLKRKYHASIDVKRLKSSKFVCPWCNKTFVLEGNKLHNAKCNRTKGKAGPFCSKSCAGKYGTHIQAGGDTLPINQITVEYTTLKQEPS